MVTIRGIQVRRLVTLLGATLATAGALAGGGHDGARSKGPSLKVARVLALAVWPAHVPRPGTTSGLKGIFCTESANCWAVGNYSPAAQVALNEVLHWNGSAWSKVSVPSPAGARPGDSSALLAVRCASPRDCWAVGAYQKGVGNADLSQALHWNGRRWAVVPVPNPGGTLSGDFDELFDVECPSPTGCWAVGRYGTESGGTVLLNLVLHWNGRKWLAVGAPEPAGSAHGDVNELNAIRCMSAASCLAVGAYGSLTGTFVLLNEVLRWNGTRWSQVGVPSPGGHANAGAFSDLMGLACTSRTNCWGVGTFGNFFTPATFIDQALHWNGRNWSQVAVPEPDGDAQGAMQDLVFAACRSATDCWAVGNYVSPHGKTITLNQMQHWDGGVWSLVSTPEPGGTAAGDASVLSAVRCLTSANCWAVGAAHTSGKSDRNQALHWSGIRWSAR
jgi:hypothetical protein